MNLVRPLDSSDSSQASSAQLAVPWQCPECDHGKLLLLFQPWQCVLLVADNFASARLSGLLLLPLSRPRLLPSLAQPPQLRASSIPSSPALVSQASSDAMLVPDSEYDLARNALRRSFLCKIIGSMVSRNFGLCGWFFDAFGCLFD